VVSGTVKLTVREGACVGHGRCYTAAADLLTYDDEGYVSLRDSSMEVPAGQEDAAEAARQACPEGAIVLELTTSSGPSAPPAPGTASGGTGHAFRATGTGAEGGGAAGELTRVETMHDR
jgi:ferredoxin